MSLARFGDFTSFIKFLSFSALGGVTTFYLMNPRERRSMSNRNLIVATGCDSGLGYSVAVHCHRNLNMSVVACVHNIGSKGALKLKDLFTGSNRSHIVNLEITEDESVKELERFVKELLEKNKKLELTALFNNAGVMCFGETEWQTGNLIDQQISVNLTGTIRVTKAFLPLVRQHKSRIINVTSHCGLRSLPGLPIYCATKAGLKAFTDSLRLDMNKYGVEVVNFVPGSFVLSSNIAALHSTQASKMRESFSEEQLNFYGDYFDRYNEYLNGMSGEKDPQMVDHLILNELEDAMMDSPPKAIYICEPFRYKFYHALFKVTPQPVTDWLLHKFVSMPEYDASKSVVKS